MRITLCVDALEPQLGGIGRYTWELCKGLHEQPGVKDLRYFARNRLIDDPSKLMTEGYKPRRLPWPLRTLKRQAAQRVLRSSVVHGPNYFLPAGVETGVITVHDLSVFLYPETHPAARVRAFERQFMHSLARASKIITDSETVRREIIDTFSISPDRVEAVHLGVDEVFRPRPHETIGPDLTALGLRAGEYALCVSTLEPRKKIAELIDAWRLLPETVRDRFPLVLAGGSGWRNEALLESIKRGVAEGWLRHLGFVPEATLPKLYAGAALFLYPSIYEGFGLPPLEAMASGVPVLVSDRSCLPEIGGDAARYVKPDDIAGFAKLIEEALTDAQWQSTAKSRGLNRAATFSWKRCIEATNEVYQKLNYNR